MILFELKPRCTFGWLLEKLKSISPSIAEHRVQVREGLFQGRRAIEINGEGVDETIVNCVK